MMKKLTPAEKEMQALDAAARKRQAAMAPENERTIKQAEEIRQRIDAIKGEKSVEKQRELELKRDKIINK